jgi:hypothetical protein
MNSPTEALPELFCMIALGKAENPKVGVVAEEGMSALAQRQFLTETSDHHVVGAAASMRRYSHLTWPVAIDQLLAEFAFSVDHSPRSD